MRYTITTYDDEGNQIVSRDYYYTGVISGENLETILDDSITYLQEQAIDNAEPLEDNDPIQ